MAGNNSLRILLVDDDRDLIDLLKYNFEKDGFLVQAVTRVGKVMSVLRKYQPNLIVLDIMMPDGNGIELCREIRRYSRFNSTRIFMLSARSESYFREAALNFGADDFIEKLSGIRVLTNKVSAVLKNQFIIKKSVRSLSADGLILNKRAETAYFGDEQITLSKPEFEILFFLMQNPDKAVSRKNLIRIIWGSELYVLDSSVQNYIENLQRKVGRDRVETLDHERYRFNQRSH